MGLLTRQDMFACEAATAPSLSVLHTWSVQVEGTDRGASITTLLQGLLHANPFEQACKLHLMNDCTLRPTGMRRDSSDPFRGDGVHLTRPSMTLIAWCQQVSSLLDYVMRPFLARPCVQAMGSLNSALPTRAVGTACL